MRIIPEIYLLFQQESTFSKARQIIKKDGFGSKGLNRGLTATLGRHGVWNCVYFGLFHTAKSRLPKTEVFRNTLNGKCVKMGLIEGAVFKKKHTQNNINLHF